MKRNILLGILSVCLLYTAPASATEPQGHSLAEAIMMMQQCAKVEHSLQRLSCYDKIQVAHINYLNLAAIPASAAPAGVASANTKTHSPNWTIQTTTSKLTDKESVVISTNALEPMQGTTPAFPVTPRLTIACNEGKTEFSVFWDIILGAKSISTIERIDGAKAHTVAWKIGADQKTAYNASPIASIKKLLNKQKLLLGITPFMQKDQRVVEFDISGLEEVIQPLQQSCNWR